MQSSNPRSPGKRVSQALKKYVKQQVALPKQWTPARVRVDEQGNVKLKFDNPAKLNGATRSVKGVKAVASRNVRSMTYGTSYFTSKGAAVRYYRDYEGSMEGAREAVDRKLRGGEIHIGKPPLKPGERLSTIDGGKRYAITN